METTFLAERSESLLLTNVHVLQLGARRLKAGLPTTIYPLTFTHTERDIKLTATNVRFPQIQQYALHISPMKALSWRS